MLGNDDIKNIIDDCLDKNKVVSTKDIAYVILCLNFEDSVVAYKCVFGSENYDSDMHDSYDACDTVQYLKEYIPYCIERANKRNDSHETQIDYSFDDNKAYMLKLKQETEKAMEDGKIGKKDGLTILKDIAVKLNDKFNVADTFNNNVIIVNKKYNSVCSRCGAELYIPTKRDLMEKYNLIER